MDVSTDWPLRWELLTDRRAESLAGVHPDFCRHLLSRRHW
jgi:hypothetical protein